MRQGKPLDAATLARKYGAREDALAGVLQYNAMPIVFELPGGQMIGDWPRAPRPAAAGAAAGPPQEQQQEQQEAQEPPPQQQQEQQQQGSASKS